MATKRSTPAKAVTGTGKDKVAAKSTKVPTKAAPASAAKPPAKAIPAKGAPAKGAPAKVAAGVAKGAARAAKAPADKFLAEQQALLLSERAMYTAQAETLRAEADALAQDMEPGDVQFDDESGEGATMNVDRERDLALSAQARLAVEEIDVALAKIGHGTYGICERCGTPIPRQRLKALPQARLCVGCKSGGLSRR